MISGNGKFVAFSSRETKLPASAGGHEQIYRMDLTTHATVVVSQVGRMQGDNESFIPSLSRSGRYVGFGSDASNLADVDSKTSTDVFVADLTNGTIVRASQNLNSAEGNSPSASTGASLSGDGHTLIYESYADNLVAGDQFNWEEVIAWRDDDTRSPPAAPTLSSLRTWHPST